MVDTKILKQMLLNTNSVVALLQALADVETAGATWILAIPPKNWEQHFHEHALDELRHAKKLRELARKLRVTGEAAIQNEREENFGVATDVYLRHLFSGSYRRLARDSLANEAKIDHQKPVHLYTGLALAVERRLMKIYPTLAKHAEQPEVREAAIQLIAEEKGHLSLVTRIIHENGFEEFAERAIELEEKLAEKWFNQLATAWKKEDVKNEIPQNSIDIPGSRLALFRV
jgi:rubrerythrin